MFGSAVMMVAVETKQEKQVRGHQEKDTGTVVHCL